jgi:preprotein translocase subunit SecG
MEVLQVVIGIVIVIMSVALTLLVLGQSSEDGRSNAIMGIGETFLGKDRAGKWDKLLSTITTILSVVFVFAVIAMYIITGI